MTDEEIIAAKTAEALARKEAADAEAAKEAGTEEKSKDAGVDESAEKKPSDAEAKLLKEVMKYKEAAKAAEARNKELSSRFGDVDIDKAREALAKLEAAENAELERKGEYDRLLAKQREAAEAEAIKLKAQIDEIQKDRSNLVSTIDNLTMGSAFANSSFIKDNLILTPAKTKTIYGDHFETVDGTVVAYDKPKGASNRTMLIDASGDPVSFEKAIEVIINADPDKDYLLKSTKKPGSGSKPSIESKKEEGKFIDTHDKIKAGLESLLKKK